MISFVEEGIQLYWSPGSCARVPFVALEEIGVDYTLHNLNRYIGDHETEEFGRINPKRKVPVLVLDDWVVTENPVILTVLDRRFPEAGLLPHGDERARFEAISMLNWFASGIQPAAGRQRFPAVFSTEGDLEGIRLAARRDLEKAFAILERRLEDRDWLCGERTILDINMLWLWFRAVGSGVDPEPFPRCRAHGERCESLAAVTRVLDREESEFAAFEAGGTVPAAMPPHQVGRVPLPRPIDAR